LKPTCSIVVPVHNRAGLTRRCLDAILAEPPAAETEIIVVDDGSTDETASVLAAYGGAVRALTRPTNGGFATACNDGAAAARGEYVVFLNNDTLPRAGWLDALAEFADRHPRAAVVGSKLLFANETVQHAGVVICQDGRPRHIYAGFPADHPAVSRPRRFQAVTFASALVRRGAFAEVGGLDASFRNCLEDADFCLRVGERDWEVHYCPDSVVYHLESVSRGRRSKEFHESEQLFRERWGDRVRRDDFDYYLEDRLIRPHYRDSYPLPIEISPQLALPGGDDRLREVERALEAATREAVDLLRENARLTAHIAQSELGGGPAGRPPETAAEVPMGRLAEGSTERPLERPTEGHAVNGSPAADPARVLRRLRELEQEIFELQSELAAQLGGAGADGEPDRGAERFAASERLGYRKVVDEVRECVRSVLPEDATVLVVSRGDDDLLALGRMRGLHFPQDDDGLYAGAHPKDSAEAIAQLEQLRAGGAEYIVFPSPSFWWLDHYIDLKRHLEERYELLRSDGACLIFALGRERAGKSPRATAAGGS